MYQILLINLLLFWNVLRTKVFQQFVHDKTINIKAGLILELLKMCLICCFIKSNHLFKIILTNTNGSFIGMFIQHNFSLFWIIKCLW